MKIMKKNKNRGMKKIVEKINNKTDQKESTFFIH